VRRTRARDAPAPVDPRRARLRAHSRPGVSAPVLGPSMFFAAVIVPIVVSLLLTAWLSRR
jgi:hypothetical protein